MGIIKPKKRKRDPEIAEDAIMIIPKREIECLVKEINAEDLGEIDGCLYRLYLRDRIPIFGPFLGAPHATIGLERIIALGARRIWVFSWCGSINEYIRIGDVLIPIGSFSEEGVSQHYPIGSEIRPDPDMIQRVKNALKKENILFHEGIFWTTDAPYRETEEKVREYQEKGVVAVDMEISALMRVAIYRKVSLASVFVVSDELFSGRWKPGFSDKRMKEMSKKIIRIIFDLAKK